MSDIIGPPIGTAAAVRILAEWIAAGEHSDLPADVLARGRLLLADSISVALRGAEEPETSGLWAAMSSGDEATVMRRGLPRASVADAIVANAVSLCALELDPGSRPSGHPMLHVLPAALAVAEHDGATGADLETALILGYEAHARFQWAIELRPEIHAHGALASVGALVAIGKLRGWDGERLARALAIAASLSLASSWSNATGGYTVRDLYAASGATIALLAARAAEVGFAATPASVDETFGRLLGVRVRPAALHDDLGTRFWIRDAYVKYHAACLLIHPVLDAIADAVGATSDPTTYPPQTLRSRIGSEAVSAIRVWVPERSVKLDVRADTALGARFSIPHMAAYYLVHGSSGPEASSTSALADAEVRRLSGRVEVIGDPGLTDLWPEHLAARIEIASVDGSLRRGECRDPIGSRDHLDAVGTVRAKSQALLAGVFDGEHVEALWAAATMLSDLASARDLLRSLHGRRGVLEATARPAGVDITGEGRAGHSIV